MQQVTLNEYPRSDTGIDRPYPHRSRKYAGPGHRKFFP